jgi:N6-adenosine-specific RNA methylase IME4
MGICITALRHKHSRKPDKMIPLIEDLFDCPYLELFGSTQRPGWTVCGNQTDKFKGRVA